jgi:hypothetical protein
MAMRAPPSISLAQSLVPARPVQRTIRIGIDQHSGRFPLLGSGVMSDELARATQLQCFGRSRRRYEGHRHLRVTGSHLIALPCDMPAASWLRESEREASLFDETDLMATEFFIVCQRRRLETILRRTGCH